jgi:hypothetical protein
MEVFALFVFLYYPNHPAENHYQYKELMYTTAEKCEAKRQTLQDEPPSKDHPFGGFEWVCLRMSPK